MNHTWLALTLGFVAGLVVMSLLRRAGGRTRDPAAPLPPLTGDLETDVRQLLEAEQKIAAIKLVRERTGCGLMEAKNQVEAFERRLKG